MDGETVDTHSSVNFLQKGGISGGALSETRPHVGSASVRFVIFLIPCIAFLLFSIIFCVEIDVVWNPTLCS
jgi:hypothetical protein